MDVEHICLHCMEDKGGEEACPNCGRTTVSGKGPLYLEPGSLLRDKYLVGRVLGHGGFGITYLAFDMDLKVKLAVKEYLPSELATRGEGQTLVSAFAGNKGKFFEHGLEKFLEEARTLAQFENHPTIVTVKDYFRENNTAYFVMPYIEGATLKQFLDRKGGKVSYKAALKIMLPVLDALRAVHKAGLLHRDVSPANIFISREAQVKLLDFGAARQSTGERSRSLSVILKPGYAPAEQYASKGKHGTWSDVYAAAATLYRAITGVTPPEAVERMGEDTLATPSSLGANLPMEAEEAIMQALAVRIEDRISNIEELHNKLTSALVTQSLGPGAASAGDPDNDTMLVDSEVTMVNGSTTQAMTQGPLSHNASVRSQEPLPPDHLPPDHLPPDHLPPDHLPMTAQYSESPDWNEPGQTGAGKYALLAAFCLALVVLVAGMLAFRGASESIARIHDFPDATEGFTIINEADAEVRNGLIHAALFDAHGDEFNAEWAVEHLGFARDLLGQSLEFNPPTEQAVLIQGQMARIKEYQELLSEYMYVDGEAWNLLHDRMMPSAHATEQNLDEMATRLARTDNEHAARAARVAHDMMPRMIQLMERMSWDDNPALRDRLSVELEELEQPLGRLDEHLGDAPERGIYEAALSNLESMTLALGEFLTVDERRTVMRRDEMEPKFWDLFESMDPITMAARERLEQGQGPLMEGRLRLTRLAGLVAAVLGLALAVLCLLMFLRARKA
ncbi:MAG: hypothetical protein D6E12_15950 [Desulfovibrio sp.]|nr:MAG: hypothetical protein D6E12_15950 [Desulfovibrio sp.]